MDRLANPVFRIARPLRVLPGRAGGSRRALLLEAFDLGPRELGTCAWLITRVLAACDARGMGLVRTQAEDAGESQEENVQIGHGFVFRV